MPRPIYLLLLLGWASTVGSQEISEDSLRLRLRQARTPEQRAEALFDLGYALHAQHPDSTLAYANQVRQLAESVGFVSGLGMAEEMLAQYYLTRREAETALEAYRKAANYHRQAGAFLRLSETLKNTAFTLSIYKRYGEAIECSFEALDLQKTLGRTDDYVATLTFIGHLHTSQNQLRDAERYLRQALESGHLGEGRYRAEYRMGEMFETGQQLDSALHYFTMALETARRNGNPREEALQQFNLGEVRIKQGDLSGGEVLLKTALTFFESRKERFQLPSVYLALAGLNNQRGQYQEALLNAGKANEQMGNTRNYGLLAGIYRVQMKAYEGLGKFPAALQAAEQWKVATDSVRQKERTALLADAAARYRSREQDATIARQTLDLERTRSRNRLLFASALLALVAGGGLALYLRARRQRTELQLQLKKVETRELRELDRAKSAFFANISHEFRTPLTLIISPLRDIRLGRFKGDLARTYGLMERNAERLLTLVNQLLDLSRLESGKLTLHLRTADLSAQLRALAGAFESLAAHRQIRYEMHLPDQPVWAHYDTEKLEQVVTNLLSNAFKFTKEEGWVRCSLEVQSDAALPLRLRVADSGIGIPANELPHIFERFYQVEQQEQDTPVGSGIGLALTKELAQLMGGQIEVQSVENQGTVFSVLLPWHRAEALAPPDVLAPTAPPLPHPTHTDAPLVLIAEDHPDVRAYLREQLQDQFRLLEADNGQQALELAQAETPDLILTDLMMPGLNGNELTRSLKSDPRTSHIPVVMLTAKAERSHRLEGIGTGAEAYLTKPIDSEELGVVIANLLKQRKLAAEKYSQQIHLGLPTAEVESLDEQFLRQVLSSIEANLDDEFFGVEQLAAAVGMSRSNLFRKLTALTGKNPNALLRELRLQRAKELLEQGAGTASEVAWKVGFNSRAYFSKCFTEQYGVAPGEVRKQPRKLPTQGG